MIQRPRDKELPKQKPMAGRVPVHDLDAEAAVLSAMLLSRESVLKVRPILQPKQCYSDPNERICEAIYAVADAGVPVDVVSVASYLRDREQLQQVGGATYLAQLADATPAMAHVEAHALLVVRKWIQRQSGVLGHTIAAESYGDVGNLDEWVHKARRALTELVDTGRSHTEESLKVVLGRVVAEVSALADQGKRTTAVKSGFKGIDDAMGGLYPGRITYLAARPGVGKSSLVRNIAINVAGTEDGPQNAVVIIQLEGTKEEVARGMLCSEAKVDVLKFTAGMVQPDDWRALTEAGRWLSALPIWIEDRSCTVDDIIAIVRRKQEEFNRPATETERERRVVAVAIDYVQRVKATDPRMDKREALAVISARLKEDLAKGCNVHVFALAAMNRDVEKRKGGKPQLSDLRDCGDLESDADAVIFLDRPRGGGDDKRGETRGEASEGNPNVATAFFGKNRFGAEGATFKMRFMGAFNRFIDMLDGDD